MIPQLPSLQTCEAKHEALSPPQGFRGIVSPVSHVRVNRVGFARPNNNYTLAQRNGLRYEDRAQVYLHELLGPDYSRSPWIRFVEHTEFGDDKRACVPDGLLIRAPNAFVFEIKIRHTTGAWFQLRKLYAPVVGQLPFISRVICVEICSSFDPNVIIPEDFSRIWGLEHFIRDPWSNFGVYVWK